METNQAPPETMTPRERLHELSSLLARGFLRMRAGHVHSAGTCILAPQNSLDFPCEQSVHRVEPQRQETERKTR